MQQANSPVEVLTKDDLVGWFLHPATKKVRYKVEQEIASCRNKLADGWTLSFGGGADKTAMLTAREVGKLEGLEFLFELEADE